MTRIKTYHTQQEFYNSHSIQILTSFVGSIILAIIFKNKYGLSDLYSIIIMVISLILSIVSWGYYYKKYTIPGYFDITDGTVLRNQNGKETLFILSTLREVELPDEDEIKYGADYINLYFGDGRCLEIEKMMPNFTQTKTLILSKIAVHPDLDFLRRRLTKMSAA